MSTKNTVLNMLVGGVVGGVVAGIVTSPEPIPPPPPPVAAYSAPESVKNCDVFGASVPGDYGPVEAKFTLVRTETRVYKIQGEFCGKIGKDVIHISQQGVNILCSNGKCDPIVIVGAAQ